MSNKENRQPENGHVTYTSDRYSSCSYGSDEDTEDASETAFHNDEDDDDDDDEEEEYIDIKERMYHVKLSEYKSQLKQLEDHNHPAYVNGLKALREKYMDRQFKNVVFLAFEMERIKREHELEKQAALDEFNEKQKELKENLIADLEEKKKIYEAERDNMDITSDITDNHLPIRKLRRRGNDPSPAPETKRRKISSNSQQIKFQLTEDEINEDLKQIKEGLAKTPSQAPDNGEELSNENGNLLDIRVENGKLYYEKYWYHRGQQIYYDGKHIGSKISAVISAINPTEIWVKRSSDNGKYQIYISELLKGVVTLKRRSA
ncbi:sin3 histone deacetylase corepressor complex component SDS3-like [Argiope bruennichi]|uniref:Sin3 histone deacetylase corepressor complex like protein n=1 Tax=Argiope bruennichi TaxID=94029 RepID=A0A8T0FSU6_ARGBR|nr:sin3 histone deacetylase corepressor complex component SDS3-like [Argiope bruennichi]KAF8792759.1 Sin3 histone deacetylase corepressor complex like protein [Argiope bruennichi]